MTEHDRPVQRTPSLLANPISMLGALLALVSFLAILFMMVIEATSAEPNPYTGIFTFVVLPGFLVFGLILCAFGASRERKRRRRDGAEGAHWPIVDFNNTGQRRTITVVSTAAVVFLGLSAFGSFKAYEYTDSNEFCGTMCHEVMEPEYTAYQNSPHSRVHCVECHIGPGAEWFVRAKISGAYQVYAVLANKIPRPIHTPVANLRPSSDTCETCHWPEKFFGNTFTSRDYYVSDEENTHVGLEMMLRVGGGDGREGPNDGIHWHVSENNKVEYVAADERRQQIDWFRVTRDDGTVSVYVSEDSDLSHDEVPEGELRTMDCIDCHNRPSHRYLPPHTSVNRAMAQGTISTELPSVKALSVELIEAEYETKDEALEAIATGMHDAYDGSADPAKVESAVAELQQIYRLNYFPSMKTDWRAFPENIGHLWAPGCFRCHDGMHFDEEERQLSRDCNVCHVLLAEETAGGEELVSLRGVEFQHPEDIDLAWQEMVCTECHAP
jgi:hypothetical protein